MKFRVSGVVKPFEGNGRKLGYPTANIEIAKDTEEGLFFGTVLLEGNELPAIIFIGAPVTLDDNYKRAEAYILDFEDRDLYGEEIKFNVEEKFRNNKKFDSIDELINQMKADEAEARQYFGDRL